MRERPKRATSQVSEKNNIHQPWKRCKSFTRQISENERPNDLAGVARVISVPLIALGVENL